MGNEELSSHGQKLHQIWTEEQAERIRKNEPLDDTKRRCVGTGNRSTDCKHLWAAVSWWCKSKDAIKYRGTRLPGVHNCPFWEPRDGSELYDNWDRTGNSGCAPVILIFVLILLVIRTVV